MTAAAAGRRRFSPLRVVARVSAIIVSGVAPSSLWRWRARGAIVAPGVFAVVVSRPAGRRSPARRGLSLHYCPICAWASGAIRSPVIV